MREPRRHVFISYVRENAEDVDRLAEAIRSSGVQVWLDREALQPGIRWRNSIRRAIEQGAFFLACFSAEYVEKRKSYMNEELTLAIDELRAYPTDKVWFIPVRLSPCEIPDRAIGAGETLRNLQCVDLFADWDRGVANILRAVVEVKQHPPQGGNDMVHDPTRPMGDRLSQLAEAWIKDGRGANWLLSGKEFFAAYCWTMDHGIASPESDEYDANLAAFIDASLTFIGGPGAWDMMLREKVVCFICNDHFRMENIRICTHCWHYFCGFNSDACVCHSGEMVG
jgi:TIR domain